MHDKPSRGEIQCGPHNNAPWHIVLHSSLPISPKAYNRTICVLLQYPSVAYLHIRNEKLRLGFPFYFLFFLPTWILLSCTIAPIHRSINGQQSMQAYVGGSFTVCTTCLSSSLCAYIVYTHTCHNTKGIILHGSARCKPSPQLQ